ncbi:hypothetical protein IJT93_12375 [bacterium]|nr:hypothetical protein [bacterium]
MQAFNGFLNAFLLDLNGLLKGFSGHIVANYFTMADLRIADSIGISAAISTPP